MRDWAGGRGAQYRSEGIKRLIEGHAPQECVIGSPALGRLNAVKWRLAVGVAATAKNLESSVHAVERVASTGHGQPVQYCAVRFIYVNKLTKDDRLLVAFDALVLSELLGHDVNFGKIIHGDDCATLKVRIPFLAEDVQEMLPEIESLVSAQTAPDLVLKPHCGECEFLARCRQKAVEKDDLSLLSSLKETERRKLNSEGIFTVNQLSYTFRPRRRPKRWKDKREPYHHSLKALAIREKKIHVVGTPELKIEGTPVYFDVEGLPDRDFYYLIGVRVKVPEGILCRSFWADDGGQEKTLWTDFTDFLGDISNPCLVHYGSFESQFLKRMISRYGGNKNPIGCSVNVRSTIYGQIYYPTLSNGLKEIAKVHGFKWSEPNASGTDAILWRHAWESSQEAGLKAKLLTYNAEDCEALALVAETIPKLATPKMHTVCAGEPEVVAVDVWRNSHLGQFGMFSSPLSEFVFITEAAHWDSQRDRIHVRSDKRLVRARLKARSNPKVTRRLVIRDPSVNCFATAIPDLNRG